jgi:hypothetical protein
MRIESTKATIHLERKDIKNLLEVLECWEDEHPYYDHYDGDDHWELRHWVHELKQSL